MVTAQSATPARERAYEAYLEQARQDAENLTQAKSRFLANMSHELRTPLNAVIGFSDIMRSALFGPLSARYAEYAGLIHESGGHLLDLINDVLDMSKIEAERFTLSREPFDAREAVSAALRLTRVQADSAKVALRGVLPPEALEVDADRRALKQIVLNLVSNALEVHPHRRPGECGGAGPRSRPGDHRRRHRHRHLAGRSAAARPALRTEPARRRSALAGALGLGLSLVRAFAELHGGQMTINSLMGEGTAVTPLRLPGDAGRGKARG